MNDDIKYGIIYHPSRRVIGYKAGYLSYLNGDFDKRCIEYSEGDFFKILEDNGIEYTGYTHLNGTPNMVLSSLLGTDNKGMIYVGQFRRAIQLFIESIEDEESIMEVAQIYNEWNPNGHYYKVRDLFRYGYNEYGDDQVYKVVQAHISQSDWTPNLTANLYKAIGYKEDYPIWVQPLGSHDAYRVGEIVWHNNKLWECKLDYCVYEPGYSVPGVVTWVEYTKG